MRILTVVSGLDFINYTRRATIESIHRLNPLMDILLYNSILNIFKKKTVSKKINFFYYNFWIPEKLRFSKALTKIEFYIREVKWRKIFSKYDVIFIIDPNQYYLLPYLNKNHKLIYLLRDPSILLHQGNYEKELQILKRANVVLAVSRNLCNYYFLKYYNFVPEKVLLWPNTIDLELWDYNKWSSHIQKRKRPVIGLAGNIDFVIDLELLTYVSEALPQVDLEIAGKIDFESISVSNWEDILRKENVRYLGFIPFDVFPSVVVNWDVGLVAAKPHHEYAPYLNNNKQYQYAALGKPFVTYRLGSEYNDFKDLVFIAESKEDYVVKILKALKKTDEKDTQEIGYKIASEQSSEKRAISFLNIINSLD